MVLSRKNNGYAFTSPEGQFTLLFASETTSADEMFDTIMHELKHCVEHISGYYGIDPKSEEAAYLQGEIAKKLFPALAIAVARSVMKRNKKSPATQSRAVGLLLS